MGELPRLAALAVLASLVLAAPAHAAEPPQEEPSSGQEGGCSSNCTYALGEEPAPEPSEPGSEPSPEPSGEPGSEPASEPTSEPDSEPVSDPAPSSNSTSSNSTSPPSNSTGSGSGSGSGSGGSGGTVVAVSSLIQNIWYTPPGGSCDVIRPTGTRPYVSVNPVLGILTVNTHCLLRAIELASSGRVHAAPPSQYGLPL